MGPTAETETRGYSLEGWPKEGYDGPQPWDHDGLNIPPSERDKIGSGENLITPVVTHDYPILTSGSAHPRVHELGRKLGDLGFPNSVSRGENPFGAVDQSVMSAVGSFRAHYGVQPDPSPFGGDTAQGRSLAEAHIDPWTVEAILRAHENRA
jgi:hypothetical protein